MPDIPLTDQQHADIRARHSAATSGTAPATFEDGGVNDIAELYRAQDAITAAGGQLTRDVHQAIDAIRARWDRVLRTVQDEADRLRAERDQARAQLDATNARIGGVLALTVASREELEQMDPEQYHQAVGCDNAITDIQRMLAARTATAQEPTVPHCTAPNAQMPCGIHCRHDLCADCDRCCTCQCATAQEQ